jgi:hypothetical protein
MTTAPGRAVVVEQRAADGTTKQSAQRERPETARRPEGVAGGEGGGKQQPQGMLPARERRRMGIERGFMRLVATAGIVGIAAALGAILVSQDVAGWIVGLVIGITSVVLAALLWSSRQL